MEHGYYEWAQTLSTTGTTRIVDHFLLLTPTKISITFSFCIFCKSSDKRTLFDGLATLIFLTQVPLLISLQCILLGKDCNMFLRKITVGKVIILQGGQWQLKKDRPSDLFTPRTRFAPPSLPLFAPLSWLICCGTGNSFEGHASPSTCR